jgi:hypothetical protein
MNNLDNLDNLTVEQRYYKQHLIAVSNYQKRNRDKIREKNAQYYAKIKANKIDQYNDVLEQKKIHYINNKDIIKEQKKLYYQNVIKPKKLLLKQQQQKLYDDHISDEILIQTDLPK